MAVMRWPSCNCFSQKLIPEYGPCSAPPFTASIAEIMFQSIGALESQPHPIQTSPEGALGWLMEMTPPASWAIRSIVRDRVVVRDRNEIKSTPDSTFRSHEDRTGDIVSSLACAPAVTVPAVH